MPEGGTAFYLRRRVCVIVNHVICIMSETLLAMAVEFTVVAGIIKAYINKYAKDNLCQTA